MTKQSVGVRDLRLWSVLVLSNFCYALGPNGYKQFTQGGLTPELTVGVFLVIGSLVTLPRWLHEAKPYGIVRSLLYMKLWMWLVLFIEAILMPTYFLLFIYAMDEGTIAQVSLLSRFSPVLILFLAVIFLHEKIQHWRYAILALFMCLVGVVVASQSAESLFSIGWNKLLFLGLFVALSDAARQTLMPKLQQTDVMSDAGLVCTSMFLGGLAALVYASVTVPEARFPTQLEYGGLFLLGVVTVAIPKWLRLVAYTMSARQSLVAAASYLVPIFGGMIAWIWHGETMDPVRFLVSFCLIAGGIYLLTIAYGKKDK